MIWYSNFGFLNTGFDILADQSFKNLRLILKQILVHARFEHWVRQFSSFIHQIIYLHHFWQNESKNQPEVDITPTFPTIHETSVYSWGVLWWKFHLDFHFVCCNYLFLWGFPNLIGVIQTICSSGDNKKMHWNGEYEQDLAGLYADNPQIRYFSWFVDSVQINKTYSLKFVCILWILVLLIIKLT